MFSCFFNDFLPFSMSLSPLSLRLDVTLTAWTSLLAIDCLVVSEPGKGTSLFNAVSSHPPVGCGHGDIVMQCGGPSQNIRYFLVSWYFLALTCKFCNAWRHKPYNLSQETLDKRKRTTRSRVPSARHVLGVPPLVGTSHMHH